MTNHDRERIRAAQDRRARAAQAAHDELERLFTDPRVFDEDARRLFTDALLGLSIGAEHALEGSNA
jgi:hypothetical protein